MLREMNNQPHKKIKKKKKSCSTYSLTGVPCEGLERHRRLAVSDVYPVVSRTPANQEVRPIAGILHEAHVTDRAPVEAHGVRNVCKRRRNTSV